MPFSLTQIALLQNALVCNASGTINNLALGTKLVMACIEAATEMYFTRSSKIIHKKLK